MLVAVILGFFGKYFYPSKTVSKNPLQRLVAPCNFISSFLLGRFGSIFGGFVSADEATFFLGPRLLGRQCLSSPKEGAHPAGRSVPAASAPPVPCSLGHRLGHSHLGEEVKQNRLGLLYKDKTGEVFCLQDEYQVQGIMY